MTIVSIKIICTFSSYEIKMLSRFHNFDQVSYLAHVFVYICAIMRTSALNELDFSQL